jgi:hypothetical protein
VFHDAIMPTSTVDENYEYGEEEETPQHLGRLPPQEFVSTPTSLGTDVERSPVTTPAMPVRASRRRGKISESMLIHLNCCDAYCVIVPVLHAPDGLVSHDVTNAEQLGRYVQSAMNVIAPGKVSMSGGVADSNNIYIFLRLGCI